MRKKLYLKIVRKVICISMVMIALLATPALALAAGQDPLITPKLAFAVNSDELLLFQPTSKTAPIFFKGDFPVISAEDTTYIPIRAFCDALGYSIEINGGTGSIAIGTQGKTVVLSQIQKFADLNKEDTYFSSRGTAYTKVKNLAKVEALQTVKQDNVLLLYQVSAALAESTTPDMPADGATAPVAGEGSSTDGVVIPTPEIVSATDSTALPAQAEGSMPDSTVTAEEVVPAIPGDHANSENWDAFFLQQGDQIVLTEQLIQGRKKSVVAPKENYATSIRNTYDRIYYKPFVNPYVAYSYPQMLLDIEKLKQQYPEYITTSSVGKSVEGRDLVAIEFGNGPKHIYLFGSHHAREYISTTYIMYFINQTAYTAKTGANNSKFDVKKILNNVTYHIIPMVNPDGVNLVQNGIESVSPALREKVKAMPIIKGSQYGYRSWKSNINGVDLNRNYPENWGASKATHGNASERYQGAYPASEPEVQAVMNYLKRYQAPVIVSMHTQGKWIYWSSPSGNLGEMGKRMLKSSGFRAEMNTRAKSTGGFLSNYARDARKSYEITVELCDYIGPFPYPDAKFDKVWQPAKDLLLIVGDEIAKN